LSVAGQVGQDAVAELPPGLVEAPEGEPPDHAVDAEAPLLLERAYGELDLVVEHRPCVVVRPGPANGPDSSVAQKTDPLQQTDDLGDCGAGVPEPDDRVQAVSLVARISTGDPQAM
jgi:hypothetical protein